MADLKQIERRIRNLKQTRQMTEAMHLAAQMRLRKLQVGIAQGQSYRQGLASLLALADLARLDHDEDAAPALPVSPEASGGLLLVYGNERGFCGGFRSIVVERLREEMRGERWREIWVMGSHIARSIPSPDRLHILPGVWEEPSMAQASELADQLLARAVELDVAEVGLLSVNLLSRRTSAQVERIFPLEAPSDPVDPSLLLLEPSADGLMAALYPRFVAISVYDHWRTSKASEQMDRIQSMAKASDNADEMLIRLEREQRHKRQERITQDMLELSGDRQEETL